MKESLFGVTAKFLCVSITSVVLGHAVDALAEDQAKPAGQNQPSAVKMEVKTVEAKTSDSPSEAKPAAPGPLVTTPAPAPSSGIPATLATTMREHRIALGEAQKAAMVRRQEIQKTDPKAVDVVKSMTDLQQKLDDLKKQLDEVVAKDEKMIELQKKVNECLAVIDKDRQDLYQAVQKRTSAPQQTEKSK